MSFKLINLSTWPDKMLRKAIRLAWREGTSSAVIYVSEHWFDHGRHMEGETNLPVNPEIGWDGICYYEEKITYIFLSQNVEFPLVWWVNTTFNESYQRGMIFYSPMEYFIYCIAHELSHIWQNDNKRRKWLGAGMPGADGEMDADLYAILKLNEYRRKTKFADYATSFDEAEPESPLDPTVELPSDTQSAEAPLKLERSPFGLLGSLLSERVIKSPAYLSLSKRFRR